MEQTIIAPWVCLNSAARNAPKVPSYEVLSSIMTTLENRIIWEKAATAKLGAQEPSWLPLAYISKAETKAPNVQ